MAKKVFTDESLETFVDEVKSYVDKAVSTKANTSHTHSISNITNLQTTLDGKQATITGGASTIASSNLTANRALISNGSGKVAVSAVTSTELGYLDGVTSNVQTQLDNKAAKTHSHDTHSQKSMSNTDLNTIKTAGWYYGYTGMTNAPAQSIAVMEVLVYSQDWIVQRFIVVNGTEYIRYWHSATTWTDWMTNIRSDNISTQSVKYATSSGSATKATQDASGNTITSTYATKAELDTAKSTLQSSINGKANSSHTHTIANITNLQTTLDGKAASSHNHAASNITSGTLSSDRLPTVPIAKGGTGATTAAAALTNLGITATATELNYVDGVTSNIQTQLNGKSASSHTHNYLSLSGGNLTGVLGIGNKYELSPVYNYTNGCLINIGAAKSSTMVAIHIVGNSYNASTLPINSLFQFYDYGDGTIMNCSGVNLGLKLGSMTVYRYNNRLYAYIKQTASYQTLSFTIITNKSGLTPTIENAAAHTSGYTDLVAITPSNISIDSHTHNYAGSSSAGGSATSAVKLDTSTAGSATQPVYFSGGKPVACTYTLGKSVPSNAVFTDTDTKVTNTLATTTKAYVTGTTSATTNTGTQVFDTGVYLDTTAGQLTATTFNGTTFKGSGVATLAEVKSYLGI